MKVQDEGVVGELRKVRRRVSRGSSVDVSEVDGNNGVNWEMGYIVVLA